MGDVHAFHRLDVQTRGLREDGARGDKVPDPRLRHDQVAAPVQHRLAQLQVKPGEKSLEDQDLGNDCGDCQHRQAAAKRLQTQLLQGQGEHLCLLCDLRLGNRPATRPTSLTTAVSVGHGCQLPSGLPRPCSRRPTATPCGKACIKGRGAHLPRSPGPGLLRHERPPLVAWPNLNADTGAVPNVRDPLCGMAVTTDSAHRLAHDGVAHYF